MSKQSAAKVNTSKSKSERSKAAILAAAEHHFSRLGFAATRLEDIADELGLTRAALFYYFSDKQTLYDAMIVDAFGSFATKLDDILTSSSHTVAERILMAAEAWVDTIVNRPTLARLILRFVADGIEHPAQRIFINNEDVPAKFWALFDEGRRTGELNPLQDDPFHVSSAVIGTTVFYVGALSALVPHGQFEPLAPEQITAHKQEVLQTARRLLGIADTVGQ
jgi:TetR/AcrR family transcriptional regulator